MSSPSDTATAHRAHFIVLEGVDGSGKSTQARRLADWYGAQGLPVLLTREPGGTRLGERLRALLLDPAVCCVPRTELLLMLADRAQHVQETILPALEAGTTVICDRYSLSTLVYQGIGRGLPLDEIRHADAVATGGLRPTVTIIIDVPLEVALARLTGPPDRFEGEGRAFLARIIEGYRQLAAEDATRHLVPGDAPVSEVQTAVRQILRALAPHSHAGGQTA